MRPSVLLCVGSSRCTYSGVGWLRGRTEFSLRWKLPVFPVGLSAYFSVSPWAPARDDQWAIIQKSFAERIPRAYKKMRCSVRALPASACSGVAAGRSGSCQSYRR
eukprot:1389919-Alexandrium_andersonii.AAC.1